MKKLVLILFVLILGLSAIASASETTSESKGLSLGFELGWPFYGMKAIYWYNGNGYGLNYFSGSGSSSGWGESTSTQIDHVALRYYHNLKDNIYMCFGLGQYSRIYSYTYDSSYTDYTYSYDRNYQETLFGLGFAVAPNDYFMYEVGYGLASGSSGYHTSQITFALTGCFKML